MNKERLFKLAAFLDDLPPQKFDFGTIMDIGTKSPLEALAAKEESCGTAGCAIGWMPAIFPNDLCWTQYGVALRDDNYVIDFEAAEKFFDITAKQGLELFMPMRFIKFWDDYNPNVDATPKEVAAHIRRYVEENT